MLEDNIRAIMESPSARQLEGFHLDEVSNLLRSLHNRTEYFFTPLSDLEFHLPGESNQRTLVLGAQLNNLLVPTPSKLIRVKNRFSNPDPSDYLGLARSMNSETREILRDSRVGYQEGTPTSHSLIGTITEITEDFRGGIFRRRSPFLLVAHEAVPLIGKEDYSLKRHNSLKWEKIDSFTHEFALDPSRSKQGVGYIS